LVNEKKSLQINIAVNDQYDCMTLDCEGLTQSSVLYGSFTAMLV